MIFKNIFFVFIGFSLFLLSCNGNHGLSPLNSSSQENSFKSALLNFDINNLIMAQASDETPPPRVAFQMSAPTAVLPADKVVNVGTEVLLMSS